MADPLSRQDSQESQDSYQGLTELDPSPVEETPVEYFNESYFPDKEKDAQNRQHAPPGYGASTLGLGNHGPAFYCREPFFQPFTLYMRD
jgi:hypothetical protein